MKQANQSFFYQDDLVDVFVTAGDLVEDSDPVLEGRDAFFDQVDVKAARQVKAVPSPPAAPAPASADPADPALAL